MRLAPLAGLALASLLGCGPPLPVGPDVTAPPIDLPDTGVVPPGPSLTPQAPDVFILSPLANSIIAPGVTLLLRGVLTDDDDAASTLTARWELENGDLIETMTPGADGVVESSVVVPPEGLEGVRLVGTDPGGLSSNAFVSLLANSAPGSMELTVHPEEPSANDDLLAIVLTPAEDPDRDASGVAEIYQWYVDGELAGIEGALVDSSLTRAGEVWSVTARAYDGFELGPPAEAEVWIGLAAPSVFVSAPLGADGDLTCAVEVEGSLADAADVSWFWTVGDGAEIQTSKDLQSDAVSHCESVACRVELTLGDDVVSSELATVVLPYGADCELASPCYEQACDEGGGCSQAPEEKPCEDGDPCTLDDACVDGVCVSGGGLACEVVDNADGTCLEGACELSCDAGWLDCDGLYETGCEFDASEEVECPQ